MKIKEIDYKTILLKYEKEILETKLNKIISEIKNLEKHRREHSGLIFSLPNNCEYLMEIFK